jgi:hypothetical protein
MPPEMIQHANATARALGDVIGLVKFANEPGNAKYRDWLLTGVPAHYRELVAIYQNNANPKHGK